MRLTIVLILLNLVSCLDRTTEKPVEELTLKEVGQKINGYWKLKTVETKEGIKDLGGSDKVKYFAFDGLKGIDADLTDNGDGTYMTSSSDPLCELKERENKKIIEYALIFNDNWQREIKKLSRDELVLIDSTTTWTYIRHKIK